MSRKKILIAAGVVVVLGGIVYANFAFKRTTGAEVTTEKIERRDLEAIVSASGKIQPKKSVQISAETMGKVVGLTVNEGDIVKAGQPLLQIDPRNLETQVQNREASLATARSTLDQTKSQVDSARVGLKQAQDDFKRQESLWKEGLTTRDAYDRATNTVKTQESNLLQTQQSVKTQEQRINVEQANLDSAKYDLNKVRIVSPINGIVTRRNIEEGETAVVGTMNNAGTVLLTIADMSVIEAEVEVDETDIPFIGMGQRAKITIDALPDKSFPGKVTEVGNSPIQTTGTTTTRATNFKVVGPPQRGRRSWPCRFRRQRSARWSSTRRAKSCARRRPRAGPAPRPSRWRLPRRRSSSLARRARKSRASSSHGPATPSLRPSRPASPAKSTSKF